MEHKPGYKASSPVEADRRSYKPWFDYTILIVAHLLFFPVWILLWSIIPLLIWGSDRGPIFFRQERAGRNGTVFTVLKFRTMVVGADQIGPSWTVHHDPRITKLGRILRKTALDELPELISVWKGDMSLVGPRALDAKEHRQLEQTIDGFSRRLGVLPGLTGLAQVMDRQDDAGAKLAYDIEYISRMSPFLDTKLLFRSLVNTLTASWDGRKGKSTELETLIDQSTGEQSPNNKFDDSL